MKEILSALSSGQITEKEAEDLIKKNSLIHVHGEVFFDKFREHRSGVPEVIFAESKTVDAIIKVIKHALPQTKVIMVTRLLKSQLNQIKEFTDQNQLNLEVVYTTAIISSKDFSYPIPQLGPVGIITAGTSDIPVAKEAELTLKVMGVKAIASYDIGIAGLHRLITPLNNITNQNPVCLIVCAGMEGALPSVIAGLVDIPVIGVPVSSGYGYGGKGVSALMSMLQSCSPGLSVVNIDAGFSAGAFAGLIAKRFQKIAKNSS